MKYKHKHLAPIFLSTAFLALLALFVVVPSALAHDRVEVGPYVVVIGWEQEPVIVGERNALYFEILNADEPVEEVDLDVTVNYAGETFRGNLNPTSQPGVYTMELLPTVRGQYQVLISGLIEDEQVNELLEPEEVLPAKVLQFPEAPPDAVEMQTNIDELNSQLQTTRLLAIGALAIGIVAILVALFAFMRSRG